MTLIYHRWKHLVYRVPDSELFDIVFSCGENCPFSDDDIAEVATLVAVGLLGERVVLVLCQERCHGPQVTAVLFMSRSGAGLSQTTLGLDQSLVGPFQRSGRAALAC
jgi:hypothetical protein